MKQYTNESQTAKLIELGFEKPKNTQYIQRAKARNLHSPFIEFGETEFEGSYSIGELIEMLPKELEKHSWDFYSINIYFDTFNWNVCYKNRKGQIAYQTSSIEELVNALFEMVVKLKEEGI